MLSTLTLTYGDRLPYLQKCLKAISMYTLVPHEIIVVNNGSEEIKDWLTDHPRIKSVSLETNEGVCARNYGLNLSQGDIISQIDDDVTVLEGWVDKVLPYFGSSQIGAVGVQGAYFDGWLNYKHEGVEVDSFVDFLTGFFFVYRNIPEVRYDWNMGKFWHEESDFCLQLKAKGYRLKVCPWVVSHDCQRKDQVDWELHNKNLTYVTNKWKDKERSLNFEKWTKEEKCGH